MTDQTSLAVDAIIQTLENFGLLKFLRADMAKIQAEIFTIPTGQRLISESEAARIALALPAYFDHFQIGAVVLIHLRLDPRIAWSLTIRQEDEIVTLRLSSPASFRWEREETNLLEGEHCHR